MIYCTHCGKQNDEHAENCQFCGQPLIKRELEHEEIRELNRALHDRDNKSREEVDNALVFIVLGTTIFIVGLLFFFLSFKMDQEDFVKKLTFTCAEFWVSMVALLTGGFLLINGTVRLLIQKLKVQKEVRRTLKLTQNNSYVHYHGEPAEK